MQDSDSSEGKSSARPGAANLLRQFSAAATGGTAREKLVPRLGWRERLRAPIRDALVGGANFVVRYLPSNTVRRAYYRHALNWTIGEGTIISPDIEVWGGRGKVRIGSETILQRGCLIAGIGMCELVIGNRVAIAYRVSIILGSHDLESPGFEPIVSPITIEDYVFVGAGATIMAGVTLHEGAVVYAGAMVTKDVPPYTIVAGVPARVVGERVRGLNYNPVLD